MAFTRQKESRELELPTLIDVVFLLLIFFLVTFSISGQWIKSPLPGQEEELPNLPEAEGNEIREEEEILGTLAFQVSHVEQKDPTSAKRVYALVPALAESRTLRQALARAAKDSSLFRDFPADSLMQSMSDAEFKLCAACSLIKAQIDSYSARHFLTPSFSNNIEIRAEQDIEFRIVNYFMSLCSEQGDNIPGLTFRTISESKKNRVLQK